MEKNRTVISWRTLEETAIVRWLVKLVSQVCTAVHHSQSIRLGALVLYSFDEVQVLGPASHEIVDLVVRRTGKFR